MVRNNRGPSPVLRSGVILVLSLTVTSLFLVIYRFPFIQSRVYVTQEIRRQKLHYASERLQTRTYFSNVLFSTITFHSSAKIRRRPSSAPLIIVSRLLYYCARIIACSIRLIILCRLCARPSQETRLYVFIAY